MIDRIYKTVRMLVNTDGRGNFDPTDFNLAVNNAINEIYETYFFEVNRNVNRANRGLSNSAIENIPDRIREKIQHFFTEANLAFATPDFNLPENLRYIDTVFYNDTEIEPCKNSKEFRAISSYINSAPTTAYPIYLKRENKIRVLPATISANVVLNYMRKPRIANWTYAVIGQSPIYNPSALDFQDVDMHPSEETNIILKVLLQFGINLKEADLVNTVANISASEMNNENNL